MTSRAENLASGAPARLVVSKLFIINFNNMNDQERELKTLTCPSGAEAKIITYLTARERNQYQQTIFSHMEVDFDKISAGDEKGAISKVDASVMTDASQSLVEIALKEYKGDSKDPFNKILDAAVEDYDYIVSEVNKLDKGNLDQAK